MQQLDLALSHEWGRVISKVRDVDHADDDVGTAGVLVPSFGRIDVRVGVAPNCPTLCKSVID